MPIQKHNDFVFFIWIMISFLNLKIVTCETNLPPVFTQTLNNIVLYENLPIGTVVFQLEGYDPEGSNVTFGAIGTEHFAVNPLSGIITLIKPLDREETASISFLVTIRDRVNLSGESELDNVVQVPITFIILDENDNAPEFHNTPYEVNVNENAVIGTTIFDRILVKDRDTIGDSLDLNCVFSENNLFSCKKFRIEILSRDPNILTAAIILNETLDYNKKIIYYFQMEATDGLHHTTTNIEIRVKDVQDKPPIFQGSLSALIDEDIKINTLVLTIQARDGDTGEPHKIVYDLLSNPMEFFLLHETTGELRVAKPLDREAISDSTGLIRLTIRAREVIAGIPNNDPSASTTAIVTITVRDVNDSPPTFNKKEYEVSVPENSPIGSPLAIDMNVTDEDVGTNSKFSLRLKDVSSVFDIEPKTVVGSSQVNIHISNGTLDYENPNHRKFIVLVIAEETDTSPNLSSTATITVTVLDANDNKPIFDLESYSARISESALPGQYITTITAKDIDSGNYGDVGIRYSISGTGAELFDVNEHTGVITLADCQNKKKSKIANRLHRDTSNQQRDVSSNPRLVYMKNDGDITTLTTVSPINLTEHTTQYLVYNTTNEKLKENTTDLKKTYNHILSGEQKTCLDYETEMSYFLSYKATDDKGQGQTSVVSLRISVIDSNDSPPICESPLYRASIDEGSNIFDSPLIIKSRDADILSTITYRIIGSPLVDKTFSIDKYSGHITIKQNMTLDVTQLKTDQLEFSVEASDGIFATNCGVNITIRDVNNHSPHFLATNYNTVLEENSEIGTSVAKLEAIDLDTGMNAEIRFRIQHGSFNDFRIDENTGEVFVSRKLDYDRRNTYNIEIIATDLGIPKLSGTATLTINILNSNDKDPYFVPATQHADVPEDAAVGTVIYTLVALDPDIALHSALEFAGTDITAIDKDGNEVDSSLDIKEFFTITRNGKVIVNKKLDRSFFAVIRINVLVTDSTAPNIQQGRGLLIIQISDVNDTPPKFIPPWSIENPEYKFQFIEEQPIGTVLTVLVARDEDSAIGEYSISYNKFFEINQTSGVITAISRIDYETTSEIKFVATVSDTGMPTLISTADITVDIININDNEPKFTKSIYNFNITENTPQGTIAGKVKAIDNDLGSFGEIIYSLIGDNPAFFIDVNTGNVVVANSTYLDREQVSQISLTVVAEDKAPATLQKTATATIYINILDINDNAPIFNQAIYSSTIAENAALNPPAALLQVRASDLDEGLFGEVRYFITEGNENQLFRIDPLTGIIYPAHDLKNRSGIYNLTISARDTQGSGLVEATAKAVITILDINQHRPEFIIPALSNATIEIPGDTVQKDYLLLTVKAVDKDQGDNGKIFYYLQENNVNLRETNEFKIDTKTGELRSKKQLNRNDRTTYDIILVARDSGNPTPFESLRLLKITIIDANENQPEFSDATNPYKIFVKENGVLNDKIVRIQALPRNQHFKDVFYYMLLGNEDGAFFIEKQTGEIFTNKSLDREVTDSYMLYILASINPDLHISEEERASFSIKILNRKKNVAKVSINILDVNDNPPVFEKKVYYAGINANSKRGTEITIVNATDADDGKNNKLELIIVASNLYKFNSIKSTGSIVPSPFIISEDGRITSASLMAEYNQDRFELEVRARELEVPNRFALTRVIIWVFDGSQLVRIILSRPPDEVFREKEEIVAELRNATKQLIIVDEIRFHVDSLGRIRMDWCDLFFHAVDPQTQQISPVDEILKVIDASYDYLRDYYAGFAIENVVPAYSAVVQDEFDLAVAGLVALIIVLFVGVISFIVLCCCLKHWNLSVPVETRRKEALIKKQFIDDLNTTENPLWIEQKLKLYEEQELTMQVFSEPDCISNCDSPRHLDYRNPIDQIQASQSIDNTYATIQPRNSNQPRNENATLNVSGGGLLNSDEVVNVSHYATLRNSRTQSVYEFTGSTFQAPIRETTADLI